MTTASLAKLTTVANFPKRHMLENLAARADGSILVVASPQRQLWYVPIPDQNLPVEPLLLHTFDEGQLAQCLVEAEPNIFYVATYGHATLHRFDLRKWKPGSPVSPTKVFDFDPPAGPNGGCLIASGVMLFSDCVEGLIWRVDLSDDGLHATARVWLKHDTMAAGAGKPPVKFSDTMEVPFPGINGLRYGPKDKIVYYTTSSQDLFMRVAVNPETLEPEGEAGLSDQAITTLINGGIPQDLTDHEKIAARLAQQLSTRHRIDDELYREAEQAFGQEGLFDMVAVMGIYHTVCSALALFEVPVPAVEGLKG
jgi:hypothetical protein